MNNLDIWQKVCRPPETALKKISGGRLSGMTDINPQWRLKAMTEVFGPCGVGWKWTVEKLWTEPGPGGEVMAFALVSVWTKGAPDLGNADPVGAWSDPIPGIGGNALVAKESSGLRANDEAFKMAITDALSTAFKCLGVGADIYERKWDGSKYTDGEAPKLEPPRRIERPQATASVSGPVGKNPLQGFAQPGEEAGVRAALHLTGEDDPLLSDGERRKLFALLKDIPTEAQRDFLASQWGLKSRSELRRSHLPVLVKWIEQQKGAA